MKRINLFFMCFVFASFVVFADPDIFDKPELSSYKRHELQVKGLAFKIANKMGGYYHVKHLSNEHTYIIFFEEELSEGDLLLGVNLNIKKVRAIKQKRIHDYVKYERAFFKEVNAYTYADELAMKFTEGSEEFPWVTTSCKFYDVYCGTYVVVAKVSSNE